MHPKPIPRQMQKTSQYIHVAHENGFGRIQNQSLDRRKQISQFIDHENGFDPSKTNPYRQMQTN
jgi:hypothetical protein